MSCDRGRFDPNQDVTRAEFYAALVTSFRLGTPFTKSEYESQLDALIDTGILDSSARNQNRRDPIDRSDALELVLRCLDRGAARSLSMSRIPGEQLARDFNAEFAGRDAANEAERESRRLAASETAELRKAAAARDERRANAARERGAPPPQKRTKVEAVKPVPVLDPGFDRSRNRGRISRGRKCACSSRRPFASDPRTYRPCSARPRAPRRRANGTSGKRPELPLAFQDGAGIVGAVATPTPSLRPTLIRGEGVHVWDAEGRRYLDAISGSFAVQLGYGRADLVRALTEAASRLRTPAPPDSRARSRRATRKSCCSPRVPLQARVVHLVGQRGGGGRAEGGAPVSEREGAPWPYPDHTPARPLHGATLAALGVTDYGRDATRMNQSSPVDPPSTQATPPGRVPRSRGRAWVRGSAHRRDHSGRGPRGFCCRGLDSFGKSTARATARMRSGSR